MKSIKFSFAFCVFVLICVFFTQCYSYVAPTGLEILRSTSKELVLKFKPVLLSIDTIYATNGAVNIYPKIKDAYPLNKQNGELLRLGVKVPIVVPDPTHWKITSSNVANIISLPNKIAEFVNVIPNDSISVKQELSIESNQYALFPWTNATYLGIARTYHVVNVDVIVAQFDPVSKTTKIPGEIIIVFQFDSPKSQSNITASNNDFDYAINQNVANQWNTYFQVSAKSTTTTTIEQISTGTWVKVKIDKSGVYKIDKTQLSQLGISIPKESVSSIKLFGNGGEELPENVLLADSNQFREQPIILHTSSDGSFDDIVFYASGTNGFKYNENLKRVEHYLNHYNNSNYYLLTWGGTFSQKFEHQTSTSEAAVNFPTTYIARIFNEEELVNPYGAGSGRRYFGQQIDQSLPRTFTSTLPNLIRSGEIEYRIALAHKNNVNEKDSAVFTIEENNQFIGSCKLTGLNSGAYLEYVSTLKKMKLNADKVSADNRSILKLSYSNPGGASGSFGYLDYYEIHYPAQLSPVNNELEFFTDAHNIGVTEYNINGFSGTIYGFNITNKYKPIVIDNQSNTGGMFLYRLMLRETPQHYYLSSNVRTPEVSVIQFENLRESYKESDMLVITPSEFKESALEYKKYRENKSGLKVYVATTEDIYTTFGSCIQDPTAIRDFIAYTFKYQLKPKYVLLWGDGHFDYKNILTKRNNYIVTWQTNDEETKYDSNTGWQYTECYTSDDYFVKVAGDDLIIDLAIGRLPIDSKESAIKLLNKIKHYENESIEDIWRTNITFLADDGPTSGGQSDGTTHTYQSEEIATNPALAPPDMLDKKIYMAEYPVENIPKGRRKPRVTEDLLSHINTKGSIILNWIGHGNPHVWAHEAIYERDINTAQFANYDKLFFLVAATCDFARFDMLETQSGAEVFVLSERGGAIATFSSSRVVFSGLNAILAKELYSQVFQRNSNGTYKSLGDVSVEMKSQHFGVNDQKFFLLGDPSLHLLIPDYVVQIDSINGNATTAKDTLTLSALSKVRVKGSIHKYGSNAVVTDFNGATTLSMFDSDVHLQVQDPSAFQYGDYATHYIEKLGGALHRGNYKVENGQFEAEFTVPKDISFQKGQAHLFAYAQSNDKRYAKGANTNFKVSGVSNTTDVDFKGPDLSIFLDSRTFLPYDVVRSNPLLIVDLTDETGINTTAIGVGHKIEAWFDDESNSTDLTDYFATSLTDSKKGTAIRQVFGFQPGLHKVKVRAWDIFNNYNEATTYFNVGQNDSIVVSSRITVFPNPFADKTTIFFTHNQGFSFKVNLDIFTVNGVKVRSFSQNITDLQSGTFQWDGNDEEGSSLSQGVYVFLLSFSAPDGTIQTATGKIMLMRN